MAVAIATVKVIEVIPVVVRIVCETIIKNNEMAYELAENVNKRSQRYKLTLKKEGRDRYGQVIKLEVVLEYGSEEAMERAAEKFQELHGAPVESRTITE